MMLSDEMLSAFLDAQLSAAEMDTVRQQLLDDEQLTERLADLAMVDGLIQQHYAQIDQRPMPEAILKLLGYTNELNQAETPRSAAVIPFPLWRRAQQQLQRHAAAVACIALFAGYGASQLNGPAQPALAGLSKDVVQLLNSATSGQDYQLAKQQLTPRLSFINQQGDFCRQYSLQSLAELSENIACRRNGQWRQSASVILALSGVVNEGQYQTASGGSMLDNILDNMMAGPALTATAEQQYLNKTNR
ncbi:anti-sigma factor family protein [Rheinheimera oceanensis]|uniref:anti-sigma factor family protein n=1 Tax=Rheinheimera oceanensis TaxID=2817449 RepID=UPI001BFE66C8|nr:hypothetical protein [Rheinheimera oceanensis]